MPLDELGMLRGFVEEDVSGGERTDGGPTNCNMTRSDHGGIAWTWHSMAADAGDGSPSNMSTKRNQSNCYRPYCSQAAVQKSQMAARPHAIMKTSIEIRID